MKHSKENSKANTPKLVESNIISLNPHAAENEDDANYETWKRQIEKKLAEWDGVVMVVAHSSNIQLTHQENVERHAQRLGYFECDGNAATGKRQHQHIGPVLVTAILSRDTFRLLSDTKS